MGGRVSKQCRVPHTEGIDVWIVDHDQFKGSVALDMCWALLSSEERRRAGEFRNAVALHAHLVTRASLRLILAKSCGVDPQVLCFEHNQFGRPRLTDVLAGHPALDFNLSHDGSVTVVALSRGRTVGVDVVAMPCRPGFLKIAQRFFSQQETASLLALHHDEQASRFVDLWSLKEAYVKARGEGLSRRFDSFAFDLDRPGRIGFSRSTKPIQLASPAHPNAPVVASAVFGAMGDACFKTDRQRYGLASPDQCAGGQFWLYRHFADFVIALCCNDDKNLPRVRFRRMNPLAPSTKVACEPVRRSYP